MDLKNNYKKLYQHWLNEFEQPELTKLNQNLFEQYIRFLNSINNYGENETDRIKFSIFKMYEENITYIYEDLLKMRELKIINAALALKEIDINNVIEAEKLLYQKLVSSVKGYRKVKALSILEEEEALEPERTIEPEKKKVSKIEKSEFPTKKDESEISEISISHEKEQVNFTILKFIKKTPPLVGIDLINYGPFEKEDLASIPSQNAKILILEKFAEKVDLT